MRSIFSVTTPAAETSLLAINELRAAVGVGDSSQDEALMTLGRQVSEAIANACGVASDGVFPSTLLSEACAEVFVLDRSAVRLRLSRRPVSEVASVTIAGETLDSGAYELDRPTGFLFPACGLWHGCRVSVAFTAGFTTVPASLKLAATKLATAFHAESGRDPNLKRIDIPDVMEKEFWVSPASDPLLSAEILDALAPYKQVW